MLTLPAPSALLTTTVTTGIISNSIALDKTQINGFATRFGTTFDEYRIRGVNVKIRPLTVSTGVTKHMFDEKSATVPAATDAISRIGKLLGNNSADTSSTTTMRWRARDLLDLEYTAIGTTVTPVYFKTYTDTANFGAPATVVPLWFLELDFIVEFRGLKSQ